MSLGDGGWRSVWLSITGLFVLLWVMAQDRMLVEEVWAGFLGLWGMVP